MKRKHWMAMVQGKSEKNKKKVNLGGPGLPRKKLMDL
jgi:hypothetical protein